MKKHRKVIIALLPLLCFLVIWGASLAKCEITTLIHKDEFSNQTLYEENTMIGDMEYIKILDYSEACARIYYVSKGNSLGSIIGFIKNGDRWEYNNWDVLWSTSGNADRVIWPYWWHFIYYMY